MPKRLEQLLRREAEKKHLRGERKNAYVYGTIRKVEKAKAQKKGKK